MAQGMAGVCIMSFGCWLYCCEQCITPLFVALPSSYLGRLARESGGSGFPPFLISPACSLFSLHPTTPAFTDDMVPSTTALLDAFLSTTVDAIVPLTAKGVAAGCKVFGAA